MFFSSFFFVAAAASASVGRRRKLEDCTEAMINDLWAVNHISVAADSVTCEHKSSHYKSID